MEILILDDGEDLKQDDIDKVFRFFGDFEAMSGTLTVACQAFLSAAILYFDAASAGTDLGSQRKLRKRGCHQLAMACAVRTLGS